MEHRFYPMKLPDNGFGLELRDIQDLQWTARDIIWPDLEERNTDRPDGLRRLGDSKSLAVPLNTDGLLASYAPDSVIEYCQFEVSSMKESHGRHLTIHTTVLSSDALRFSYIYASKAWHSFVWPRLLRWHWLQYLRADLPLKSSLEEANDALVSRVPNCSMARLSDMWDYADDQLPKWFYEWELIEKQPSQY